MRACTQPRPPAHHCRAVVPRCMSLVHASSIVQRHARGRGFGLDNTGEQQRLQSLQQHVPWALVARRAPRVAGPLGSPGWRLKCEANVSARQLSEGGRDPRPRRSPPVACAWKCLGPAGSPGSSGCPLGGRGAPPSRRAPASRHRRWTRPLLLPRTCPSVGGSWLCGMWACRRHAPKRRAPSVCKAQHAGHRP